MQRLHPINSSRTAANLVFTVMFPYAVGCSLGQSAENSKHSKKIARSRKQRRTTRLMMCAIQDSSGEMTSLRLDRAMVGSPREDRAFLDWCRLPRTCRTVLLVSYWRESDPKTQKFYETYHDTLVSPSCLIVLATDSDNRRQRRQRNPPGPRWAAIAR